ncbi:winged helix-turn-helix transcriptional regulator [Streptomyces sp. NPDC054813]
MSSRPVWWSGTAPRRRAVHRAADDPPSHRLPGRLRRYRSAVLAGRRAWHRRPVEPREQIGGISSKVLTEPLRRLQFNGLVTRRAMTGAPPRVEYGLTGLGRSLLGPIDAVGAWAFEHGDEVVAAQEAGCTGVRDRG